MPHYRTSKNPHPPSSVAFAIVSDWLAANDIDENILENPTFTVRGATISYRGLRFENGKRGYNDHDGCLLALNGDKTDFAFEDRTVPLRTPVTDEVRAAVADLNSRDKEHLNLIEE